MGKYLSIIVSLLINYFSINCHPTTETLTISKLVDTKWDPTEIHGYHFHTYFFQDNDNSNKEALTLRAAIQDQIDKGFLSHCRLNHVNHGPRGPHPIGSYETCCNATGISHGISWFAQNRGNLSVLLHPLTKWEIIDHTDRAMFLGKSLPLDLSALSYEIDNPDLCLPIN